MAVFGRAPRGTVPMLGILVALCASMAPVGAQISLEDLEHQAHATIADNSSNYLAAVVVQAGKASCKDRGTETICLQPMTIVELIGGAKEGKPWSDRDHRVSLFAGRNTPPPSPNDERRLIVAIPGGSGEANVALHNVPATAENVAAMRRAAGNYGRGSLKCTDTTYVVSNGTDSTCEVKPGVSARCDDGRGNYAIADCFSGCQETRGAGECKIPD